MLLIIRCYTHAGLLKAADITARYCKALALALGPAVTSDFAYSMHTNMSPNQSRLQVREAPE